MITTTSVDQALFEPTVFGAVRRFPIMVVVIALFAAAAALGYSLAVPEVYRAHATVTVPKTTLSQGEAGDQFLDSQVLLLQSREVAELAAQIANEALDFTMLSASDFSGEAASLEITPPKGATPGSFGSSIIAVSFTGPSARVAQVSSNAALQAFDDVRVAAISAQGDQTIAAIEKAIRDSRTREQRKDLVNLRTEALVNQQVDLARHPTVMWAAEPQVPINGNSKKSGLLGLVVGTILGVGLAYARATRRRCLRDRLDPAAIYDVPLIGEIPARPDQQGPSWRTAVDRLPVAGNPRSPLAEAFRFAAGFVERTRAQRGNQLVIAFVSAGTGAASSSVLANVALAAAEAGTSVLAVDAAGTDGDLTALLLVGSPSTDGFGEVLSGQRSAWECVQVSTVNQGLAVLGSSSTEPVRPIGARHSKALKELLSQVKASYDLVLINSPALLRVAAATEIVDCADATIVVVGSNDIVQDHVTMLERLNSVESPIIGYIYQPLMWGRRFARHLRSAAPSRVDHSERQVAQSW